MSNVLDASMTLTWFFEDEAVPSAVEAYARVRSEGALTPQIWLFEVRNAFVFNERRERITSSQTAQAMAALEELSVTIDTQPDLEATMALARAHGLTFYDALYLELAQRRQATLLSLDTELLRAANAEGVATL
ncbi:MAG: type II toxin-antitoxin system VapC family toxin [Chloroflexota bacterium]|nr:type II toxin-antitoxin system VapC family toxin [Chloroflexota bacterium]